MNARASIKARRLDAGSSPTGPAVQRHQERPEARRSRLSRPNPLCETGSLTLSTVIRHLAATADGADLFASAEFEKRVAVWSLARRRRVAEFDTVLDFGGCRLAVIPGEPPIVIAAAYHVHGVVAYDGWSGEQLWQRRDIKKAQRVTALDGTWIGVGVEKGPLQVLRARTGTTLRQMAGLKGLITGERGYLGWSDSWIRAFDAEEAAPVGRRIEGHPLAASAGPDGFLVGNVIFSNGPTLQKLSAIGEEQWRTSIDGWHATGVFHRPAAGTWLAHLFDPHRSGHRLLVLADDGAVLSDRELPRGVMVSAFMAGADALLVGEFLDHEGERRWRGQALAPSTLQPLWTFAEGVREVPA